MPYFSDIIGQTHIKQHLMRAVQTGNVSHAYLFAGEEMAGKEYIARIFAQALVCEQTGADGEPCCACASCNKVLHDAHPDVRVIRHEKPGSVRVKEIIEQLVDDAYLTPYGAVRKIYIVPDAHLMTTDAQNKLLKTLEEPPSYVTILLLANGIDAMLPTIRSRCVPMPLRPVPGDTLTLFLKDYCGVSDYKSSLAARFARGNTGRALRYAQDNRFETRARMTMQMMERLTDEGLYELSTRLKAILAGADEAQDTEEEDGARLQRAKAQEREIRGEMLHIIRCLLRDMLLYKATETRSCLILDESLEWVKDTSAKLSFREIFEMVHKLREAEQSIEANVNAQYVVECFLLGVRNTLSAA